MLNIEDRMKRYENVSKYFLPRRIPVIIRIDGRSFHTLTRKLFMKGYDVNFISKMQQLSLFMRENIMGCKFCYSQSDEISFLLTDYKTIQTEPWFGYNLQKIVSISASLASSVFSDLCNTRVSFDSRAFSLPADDVCNYFIWRQQNAIINAIQMAGQEQFSHKELKNVSCSEIREMLLDKNIDFEQFPILRQRGFCVLKDELKGTILDEEIPVFSQDRTYIEKFVNIRED
jgi:tRNA(His) 5'-end guanylyltransferase